MVIPSMLCFPSFLTISYPFPWCFYDFLECFYCFPSVFPPFPLLDFANYRVLISFFVCLSLKLRLATQIFWLKTQILSVACRFLKRLCFTILVKRMSLEINILKYHCVKSVQIQSFSGPYFPALGLNMEIYGVNLRIQSESVFSPNTVKYGPEKTPYLDTSHAVYHSVKSQQPLFARSKNL